MSYETVHQLAIFFAISVSLLVIFTPLDDKKCS